MAEPRFPDRLRPPLAFDPGRLAADMAAVAAAGWTEHFVKQNYDGDWSVIALRGPSGAKHPVQMIYSDPGCTDFVTPRRSPRRPISGMCWRPWPARSRRCG